MTGIEMQHGDGIWDDGEWISWEWLNSQLEDEPGEDAYSVEPLLLDSNELKGIFGKYLRGKLEAQ
jgi:hypothetical protein